MTEPRWISAMQAIRIHSEQLAIFGGPSGLHDEGALEPALDRPRNKYFHEEADLAALAAAYAFGLARNHPFVDGNKRAAFAVMMVFLRKNGTAFAPDQGEATRVFFELAAGAISEGDLAAWIKQSIGG